MKPTTLGLAIISLAFVMTIADGHDASAQFVLGVPEKLPAPINTPRNEGAPDISADGLLLYYQVGRVSGPADIYAASRDSLADPWHSPQSISINTRYADASPALAPDGQELYFSDGLIPSVSHSNRPGGMGGVDIWASSWDPESGSWGEPQNVEPLNTRYADYGPNLSADGRELYFASDRPGGAGSSDIFVARRPTVKDPWGEPTNLGPTVNSSGEDYVPTISPDGRMLIFGSAPPDNSGGSHLWLSKREQPDDDWGSPIHLGFVLNGDYRTTDPDFSYDGTTLYFGRLNPSGNDEIWQVSLLPLESEPLRPGDPYQQNFDESLGPESSSTGTVFPTAWTTSENGVVFEHTTTQAFPARGTLTSSVYNAGAESDADRTLAIGVIRDTDSRMLQFQGEIIDTDATALQLKFDVEAWDTLSRSASDPGEAAFDVNVELDTGNGFAELFDFGTITTGARLTLPTGDYVDGNLDEYRVSFDSDIQAADIPVGSQLRIRWTLPEQANNRRWVYGLDNVVVNLISGKVVVGDVDGDGRLSAQDIDLLAEAIRHASEDPTFDINHDGMVSAGDHTSWVHEPSFANTYFGDATLDGEFNSADLIAVFQAGKYELDVDAGWAEGDWSGDQRFGSSDLIGAFQDGGYELGPRITTNAVPEPTSLMVLMTGLVGIAIRWKIVQVDNRPLASYTIREYS